MTVLASTKQAKKQSVPTNGARSAAPATDHECGLVPEVGALDVMSAAGNGEALQRRSVLGDPRLLQRTSAAQRERIVRTLQRRTGNAGVARVMRQLHERNGSASLVQRLEACVEPPPAPSMTPAMDPAFKKVESKTAGVAKDKKQHPPAAKEADKAQAAAVPPGNEVTSKAAAAQVGEMNDQKPGSFNKAAFIADVEKAVDAITPRSEDEADAFKRSGKAGQVASKVGGMVGSNKEAAEKDIKQTTAAAPDPAKGGPPKPVTPLAPDVAKPRGDVNAAEGMPKPRPADQLSLAHTKCETDNQMEEANVTEEQLQKGNEPEFNKALDAKHEADANAAEAPKEVRKEEQDTLQQTKAGANAAAGKGLTGMQTANLKAIASVGAKKEGTKDKDEAQRAEIAKKLEAVYDKTKTDVTKILDDLGPRAEALFEREERVARTQFENYVEREMAAYKRERYSGASGTVLEVTDYVGVTELPDEVNRFYQIGRKNYIGAMRVVIGKVADLVGGELGRAKARIAQGRKEIDKEVQALPKNLQKIGREAADGIQSKFEQLDSDVDAKRDEMVQAIAKKYAEGLKAVDDKIAAMKEANKGLLSKAKDAIKGVIETIIKLKDMLMGVLAKAAGVIDKIIKDPIGFLGNLVAAIKQGLSSFVGNIATHLKNGLMGWLFGALGEAGIQLPPSFDLKGILSLILQLLGLTYANIRARAVSIVGEKTVALLEKAVEVFKILLTEGPAGLWKFIVAKLGEMKEKVLEEIKGFVITKVIVAGITWLVSMLNPASAFVKACKMIYDVVMFFVERGSQIMGLVNAILDGVSSIAGGAISGAAKLVENALGKALPVAISFLASLLGLGGIAGKIKGVIEKIQAPVNKLIDGVVMGAVKGFKKLGGDKLIGLAQKGIGWAKQKVKQGVQWVKAKATAAKDWAVGKVKGAKEWAKEKFGGKEKEESTTERVKDDALRDFTRRARGLHTVEQLNEARSQVMTTYRPHGLKSLSTVASGSPISIKVVATASPGDETRLTWRQVFVPGNNRTKELRAKIAKMKPEFSEQGESTVAALSVGGQLVGGMVRSTSKESHAEDALVTRHWQAGIALAKAKIKRGAKSVDFVVAVNRTPCSRCAATLNIAITEAKADPEVAEKVRFRVAATGVYEAGEAVDPNSAFRKDEEKQIRDEIMSNERKMQNVEKKADEVGAPIATIIAERVEKAVLKEGFKKATQMVEHNKVEKPESGTTRRSDLIAMQKAGWDLVVLQVKDSVSEVGALLEDEIVKLREKATGAAG